MEYGPYFFNNSGYELLIHEVNNEFNNFNTSYTLHFYSTGHSPLMVLKLNLRVLEELIYKMMDMMSGPCVVSAMKLPLTSVTDKTILSISRGKSHMVLTFRKISNNSQENTYVFKFDFKEFADFVNALFSIYLEGMGVQYECE